MNRKMAKLGSLFDGSGGFPLAGSLCGIIPVWASEIEPYPIAITRSRFPGMRHLGDIRKINGAEIEPVDIITFGSPCQDLSVAGKRAGLKHEDNGYEETTRSGLFMEAVRIIKEMREATNGEYPRFALWENVPGAFSSNKGEDFRTVLDALIRIQEPGASVPPVPKGGWAYADSYCGDGWSLAYRTLDAQYWGVPQRRRRIYLVADFRGKCAGEILFKRQGLRGYFAESRTPREGIAADTERDADADDRNAGCLNPWDNQSTRIFPPDAQYQTLYAAEKGGGQLHGVCIPINTMIATRDKAMGRGTGLGIGKDGEPQFTISAAHEHAVCCPILDDQGGQQINVRNDGKSPTLRAEMHGNVPCVVAFTQNQRNEVRDLREKSGALAAERGMKQQTYVVQSAGFKAGQSKAGGLGYQEECAATLSAQASGVEPTVCVAYDARGNGDGAIVNTITGDHENRITDYTTVICLQGNGIDRSETAGCNGNGWKEDVCYTLNTIDRPGVAYAMQGFGDYKESECGSGLKARDFKDATDLVVECAGVDCRNMNEYNELYPTLQAKPNGGQSLNFSGAVRTRYIVRRLTPTECARLQGFPDEWGHPDHKDDFTDEEYTFWMDVRNTHAAINGKAERQYTKEQMLAWYNKLHTDSAEYRMWGNGIALPTALYVMQGIAEELTNDVI